MTRAYSAVFCASETGALDYLVADAWRPEARRFFFNLYALSCHSPFVARLFNQLSAVYNTKYKILVPSTLVSQSR